MNEDVTLYTIHLCKLTLTPRNVEQKDWPVAGVDRNRHFRGKVTGESIDRENKVMALTSLMKKRTRKKRQRLLRGGASQYCSPKD